MTPEERREKLQRRSAIWEQGQDATAETPQRDPHLMDQELAKLLAMPGWERVEEILLAHTQVRLGEIVDQNWALKVAEDKGKANLATTILVLVKGAPKRLEKWKAKQEASA